MADSTDAPPTDILQSRETMLIGLMNTDRNRPARDPGYVKCTRCGCVFIGDEWHQFCRACAELIAARIAKEQRA